MARGKYDRQAAKARRLGLVATQDMAKTEPLEVIMGRLATTFRVLDRVANGVMEGVERCLMVVGAAGVGKTHAIEEALRRAAGSGKISFQSVSGTMSAISLYQLLYDNRRAGNVILLDDCDIFDDTEALNIMKAALDTKLCRMISWRKESAVLKANDVPNEFEYEGTMIFISNINIQREIDSGSKRAPHYNALVNRATFIDIGIHTKWEIFARINQVVTSDSFMNMNNLDSDDIQEMLMWVEDNLASIRSLSIRTVIHLAKLVRTDPENWIEMAEVTLLKRA